MNITLKTNDVLLWLLGSPLLFFTLFISYLRAPSFSFVDEFNSWVTGFYMTQGRVLYQDIFFNHQPLMPMISSIIQSYLGAVPLYTLVLAHRLFVGLYLFAFGGVVIWRLRYIGLGVVALHLGTMFYTFGNQFLAEALLVYPSALLFAGMWESLTDQPKLSIRDHVLFGFCFLLFLLLREPYIPAAVVMYGVIMRNAWRTRAGITAIGMMMWIVVVVIAAFPLSWYVRILTVWNVTGVISGEISQNGNIGVTVLKSFLYPLYIFGAGKATFMRVVQIVLTVLVLGFSVALFREKRYRFPLIFSYGALGLLAIRVVLPGTEYYEAYRQLPWYGALFCFACICLNLWWRRAKRKRFVLMCTTVMFGIVLLYPRSFLWSPVQREQEFTTHYLDYVQKGEIIRALSRSLDTMVVHGWGSLTYLAARRPSAYRFVFDYPVTDRIPEFTEAKKRMFTDLPPRFVDGGRCDSGKDAEEVLPFGVQGEYGYIVQGTTPLCLFVRKGTITDGEQEALRRMGYAYVEQTP